MASKKIEETTTNIRIKAPDNRLLLFTIQGTAPLVVHKFSQKMQTKMAEKQKAGSVAVGKKVREARDFESDYNAAMYVSPDGWYGMNAAAFRNASISACRTVGFKMTIAKLSIFVVADGFDEETHTPLVRIYGEPKMDISPVRNSTGVADLRARPMWAPGWIMKLRMRYDADQFSETDVANLISRVGMQVGIGEGRPDSKMSAGLGWGLFEIVENTKKKGEK